MKPNTNLSMLEHASRIMKRSEKLEEYQSSSAT